MIIANEDDYAAANIEIGELWDHADSHEARFLELADAIEVYEAIHYPIAKPSLWARFEYWLYKKGILK